MSADNGERTAASIRCEPSDGLVRNLLRALVAGDYEQPIAPRCHKDRRFRHRLPSLSRLSRAIRVVEQGHAFSLGASHCGRPNGKSRIKATARKWWPSESVGDLMAHLNIRLLMALVAIVGARMAKAVMVESSNDYRTLPQI
jgi:hypothetical protein